MRPTANLDIGLLLPKVWLQGLQDPLSQFAMVHCLLVKLVQVYHLTLLLHCTIIKYQPYPLLFYNLSSIFNPQFEKSATKYAFEEP